MQGEQPSQTTQSIQPESDANGVDTTHNASNTDRASSVGYIDGAEGAEGVNGVDSADSAKAHKHKSIELRLPMPAVTYRQSRRGNPNAGEVRVHIVHSDHSSDTIFLYGAWIVVLLIPFLVMMFLLIRRHYSHYERERTTDIPVRPADIHHRLIVPIDRLDTASVQSIAYARSISAHVTAVHVCFDDTEANGIREAWHTFQKHFSEEEETHLLIIESPYRSLVRPLLAYIDVMRVRHPDNTITVVLPEFVVAHWWEYILHNQTAFRLKASLLFRPGIIVVNIPQHLRDRARSKEKATFSRL